MKKLKYTFTHDTLFKMLFVQNKDLLKNLVANLLGIDLESIGEFVITNPEIPPDIIENKFCRPRARFLSAVARTRFAAGKDYTMLPRTIVISILAFSLFDCKEFYSEFRALEVTRHTLLTDKMSLRYYELGKLPKLAGADDERMLWLALFKAKTEEELAKIKALEVSVMEQAIEAYRKVTTDREFREIERMRDHAKVNEMYALHNARHEERKKWQSIVSEKDTALAEKDAQIAELRARLVDACIDPFGGEE
jgi:predicted transposase/invertase (TIGR01784 family)